MVQFKIKRFNELSLIDLYQALQLRSSVFVVEQNCVYQDIDGKDEKAIHVLGYINDDLVVYCRLFNSGDYFDDSSIGRVVVHPKFRNLKLGHQLLQQAIETIKTTFNTTSITISAQLYLEQFYQSHGFVTTSEMYLEDAIPHVQMKKN